MLKNKKFFTALASSENTFLQVTRTLIYIMKVRQPVFAEKCTLTQSTAVIVNLQPSSFSTSAYILIAK